MRSPTKILTVTLALTTLMGSAALSPAGENDRLETLKSQFSELKADVFAAQERFDERYVGELKKLEEKAQGEANLELVLAVREEAKVFRTRGPATAKTSPDSDLARLQKIYDDQKTKFEEEQARKLATLVTGYRKQLGKLRAELTKAGDIDGAVAVQAESDRAEADATKPADRPHDVEIDLAEVLRTRQWRRLKKDGASADFTFNVDGTILAKPGSATSWRQWKASGNSLYLTTDGSKEWVFELASEKRPYSLEAVTPEIAHLRFVELD